MLAKNYHYSHLDLPFLFHNVYFDLDLKFLGVVYSYDVNIHKFFLEFFETFKIEVVSWEHLEGGIT